MNEKMHENEGGVQSRAFEYLIESYDDGSWWAVCRVEGIDGEFAKGPFASEAEAGAACDEMDAVFDEMMARVCEGAL